MAPFKCFSANVFLWYSGLKNSKRVLQYMYEAILYYSMFPFRFCFGVALRLIAYLFLPFLSPYFCPPPPLSLSHSFCRPHVSKEAKSPVCGATLNKLLQQQQLKAHNNSVLRKKQKNDQQRTEKRCNCRDKVNCPMHGNCQIQSIVYKASVTETGKDERNEYLGLRGMTFKKRYDGHMTSMRHERLEKSTELSKLIWDMKRKDAGYSISWSVVAQTPAYSNATKRCPLCLREKLEILRADRRVNINK